MMTFADAIEFVEREMKRHGSTFQKQILAAMRAHIARQPAAPVAVEPPAREPSVQAPACRWCGGR